VGRCPTPRQGAPWTAHFYWGKIGEFGENGVFMRLKKIHKKFAKIAKMRY